ncbi:hypothetical protein COW99_00645 [Candidatus Roizmanbacteria bacterium CG22_combo_CG10-13_8_21_14_all_38_20]|uniref:Phosphoribosyltransferase domain-containing protein n=1 Tax=Candidatus Roizmanbacteria bacterium CG22_combo_CG10-13_8_21_14_all_38_20 TaxID=1974862 RepID=A0A2H0BZ04_9BACT|nr:hypothetical protein [Candidatus Microgenomates bacterium]PIP62178.1 MAG: hypothetical protein COW99_00645 [Candidatus Roizmanbacteria bacterium CG22_combo_CG10-13_8_21_14_all_38_20]
MSYREEYHSEIPSNFEIGDISGMRIIISEEDLRQQPNYYMDKLHVVATLAEQDQDFDTETYKRVISVEKQFDHTGSVRMTTFDFSQIDTSLNGYFTEKYESSYLRRITEGDNEHLRGLGFYITRTSENIETLAGLVCTEVQTAQEVVNIIAQKPDPKDLTYQNRATLLAVLDNKKHHVLELLHAVHQSSRYLPEGEPIPQETYHALVQSCYSSVFDFYNLLLYESPPTADTGTFGLIDTTFSYLVSKIRANSNKQTIINNSLLKMYREANHPMDIALLSSKLIYRYKQNSQWDRVLGIEYGGIELPFALNAFMELKGSKHIPFSLINATFSSMLAGELGDSAQLETPLSNIQSLKSQRVLVLDDNVVTGRTVDKVVRYLARIGNPSVNFACIGFSMEELLPHMIKQGCGCINPDVLKRSIVIKQAQFLYRREKGDYYRTGVFNPEEEEVERKLLINYPEINFKLQAS